MKPQILNEYYSTKIERKLAPLTTKVASLPTIYTYQINEHLQSRIAYL